MTSLEFIKKEIEYYKQKKDKAVEWYVFLIEHNGSPAQTKRAEVEKDAVSNYLDNLQQIKSELEAWYSIKQGIKLCEGKVYEDSYYEYLQFEEELFDESESEKAGERLKPIKKALEVEE